MNPTYECSIKGCENKINRHLLAVVKNKWFVQKNGTAYCTEHVPTWVAGWRSKRNETSN